MKIWAWGLLLCVYKVLLTLKCLRSFGVFPIFPIFDNLVSRKRLVSEKNGMKSVTRGY